MQFIDLAEIHVKAGKGATALLPFAVKNTCLREAPQGEWWQWWVSHSQSGTPFTNAAGLSLCPCLQSGQWPTGRGRITVRVPVVQI